MKQGRFLFLGTGGSMGIPVIGCRCDVCRSTSSFNKRLRSSGLVEISGKKLLIDAGPDLRCQALKWNIDAIDGLLLTHAHHDHTGGIDELRVYYMRSKKRLPCLLSPATLQDLHERFRYIFQPDPDYPTVLPQFEIQLLADARGLVTFTSVPVSYFTFSQLGMDVNGFRLGDLAYVSDIRDYPESIFEDLQGVKHLILSALRNTPSEMHFTVDQAVDFARRVNAEQTWFTHIAHELEHEQTNARLPSNIRLAYDSLALNFSLGYT